MPYFHNDKINLLFIHIPKTGGTSLEKYFSDEYNIPLNGDSLFLYSELNKLLGIDTTLQHMTYNVIMKNKNGFIIDTTNLDVISIVRNPYERIISDLFYLKKNRQLFFKSRCI